MMDTETVMARIRAWRKAEGISYRRLAELIGLSHNALHRIDKPTWNPRASTLQRLESLIPHDFRPDEASDDRDRAA